jgi:predicted acyl esterase
MLEGPPGQYADIYRPDTSGRFPVLVLRSPYGKEGRSDPNGSNQFFARYGYVTVDTERGVRKKS